MADDAWLSEATYTKTRDEREEILELLRSPYHFNVLDSVDEAYKTCHICGSSDEYVGCASTAFYRGVLRAVQNKCAVCSGFLRAADIFAPGNEDDIIYIDPWRGADTVDVHSSTSNSFLRLEFVVQVPQPLLSDMNSVLSQAANFQAEKFRNSELLNASLQVKFGYIKQRIDQCRNEHELCPRQQRQRLPKRVLHVGSNGARIRLCEPRDVEDFYVTLSYCWGGQSFIKTTTQNLDEHLKGISITGLPRLFQDAITLARELDIQWLWIDALCIVQDDLEDWSIESSQMDSIYRNSSFTIAASTSANPHHSMLPVTYRETDVKEMPLLAEYLKLPSEEVRLRIRPQMIHHYGPESWDSRSLILNDRGWCFQENLLSPRIIQVHQREFIFTCAYSEFCQCGLLEQARIQLSRGDGFGPAWWNFMKDPHLELRRLCFAPKHTLRLEGESARNDLWYQIVWRYAKMQLSEESDRLPALSGVVKQIMLTSRQDDKYLAGLWMSDIRNALCWHALGHVKDGLDSGFIAPTWSWASVCSVVVIHQMLSSASLSFPFFSFESANIVNEGPDSTGRVKPGSSIEIRGPLVRGRSIEPHTSDWSIRFPKGFPIPRTGDDVLVKIYYCRNGSLPLPARRFGPYRTVDTEISAFFLCHHYDNSMRSPAGTFQSESSHSLQFILLQPIIGQSNAWARIGDGSLGRRIKELSKPLNDMDSTEFDYFRSEASAEVDFEKAQLMPFETTVTLF